MCSGRFSMGCATPGTIKFHKDAQYRSPYEKKWAAMHELAHQYQFRIMNDSRSAPKFKSLLKGDLERMANCMAASRGIPSPRIHCSKAEIEWSATAWQGYVK